MKYPPMKISSAPIHHLGGRERNGRKTKNKIFTVPKCRYIPQTVPLETTKRHQGHDIVIQCD